MSIKHTILCESATVKSAGFSTVEVTLVNADMEDLLKESYDQGYEQGYENGREDSDSGVEQ